MASKPRGAVRRAKSPAPTRRVLLKLSGEMLAGPAGRLLDDRGLGAVADQIAGARETGAEVAVVIGGGNLLRGGAGRGPTLPRTTLDTLGMLGTLMNALALQGALAARGLPARVLSAVEAPQVAERYTPERGRECLARGEVVLCAGGTGHSFFTTDTAAALRALELDCTLLVKGTKVDGVYSADPVSHPRARRFAQLSFAQVLRRRLGVMDLTAITLCMEYRLPVVVLNAAEPGSIRAYLRGEPRGTRIQPA
jgi:uridylate kinase